MLFASHNDANYAAQRILLKHFRRSPVRQKFDVPLELQVFASLKTVLWVRRVFADAAEAEHAVFEHVEVCSNRERLRSSLGYVSPATFESQQPACTANSTWGSPAPAAVGKAGDRILH
jgi:transposase InsO family protein